MTAASLPLAELLERAAAVRLLALDVDGVMTPGEIMYQTDGERVQEIKVFNAKDGLGIQLAHRAGIRSAVITGRTSLITAHRVEELGMHHLHQRIKNKLPVLEAIAEAEGISLSQVAYMGDDLPDLSVLKAVGLACCPADAVTEVRDACHFISNRDGGKGAVRELVDLLLQARRVPENESTAKGLVSG